MRVFVSNLWQDIRYAARRLRLNPAFTAAAVLTIALGIGVNTGIFSIFNGVALSELPAPDADDLVSIHQIFDETTARQRLRAGPASNFSTPEYRAYRDNSETLSGLLAYSQQTTATIGDDAPQPFVGTLVTCNYFAVLQRPPALGPGFAGNCDEPGAAPTVVLGHDVWTKAFNADPDIIGRDVLLDDSTFTVVGVADEAMRGVDIVAVSWFAPISSQPELLPIGADMYENENWSWLTVIGRRAGNTDIAEVRAELGVIANRLDQQHAGRQTTLDVATARRLASPEARAQFLTSSSVIMAAFGLVLLIACANVANLLLARASGRTHEIAVRMSLGASRSRVVQQLLAESVLIAFVGGALGLLLAMWSSQSLFAFAVAAGQGQPITASASFDVRVLTFALAATLASGVLCGLAPAFNLSKPDLHTDTKLDASGIGMRSGNYLQRVLLGAQVTLSMVLMISAGLQLRSLYQAQTVEPGFDYENVAVATFDFARAGYDASRDAGRASALQRELAERIEALPGIEAAARVRFTPLAPGGGGFTISVPGQTQPVPIVFNVVSPDYFSLLRIPIVRGRTFTEAELTAGPGAVVVTESTARRLWPDREAIGQTFSVWNPAAPPTAVAPQFRVVGVARDAEVRRIGEVPSDYIYVPAGPTSILQLVARSTLDFDTTAAAIRTATADLDPALTVRVSPLEANLEVWRSQARVASTLALTLGVLALTLAAVGVYGVVAFAVNRRLREIGVRLALGANVRSVLALILKRTMWPVLIGGIAGAAGAAAVSRVLSSTLFGVSPLDPIGIGGAVVFVLGVAAASAVLAARPAMRSDPIVTLRYE